jgi:tetratricopeptide (TPR) repeat protein
MSPDARYALAHYQFEIGRARGDMVMQSQAVDIMVESGLAPPAELASLLANQASRAYSAGDVNGADRLLARAVAAQPNNAALAADAGQLRARIAMALTQARRTPEAQAAYLAAIGLIQHAIELQQASGQPAPESWYLRGLALAYDNRLGPQAIALGRGLVAAYPSAVNWRDALLAYRELAPADPANDVEAGRLLRAGQALAGERDYTDLAQALTAAGLPGEAKAVLDEGVTRGVLSASKPATAQLLAAAGRAATAARAALPRQAAAAQSGDTGAAARTAADAAFSFGQYAAAADLYRLALQKGGEDANLVNLRLGATLALAGRAPEARAALAMVGGPRADLAGFWLAWLQRRPA